MKHTVNRLLAMSILTALLLSLVVTADNTSVMGTQTTSSSTTLAEGAVLYSSTYYNSSSETTQAENMIIFQSGTVTPVVAYGSTLYGRSTISTTASQINASTGLAVVAGINASFFEFSSGIPYGIEITDGVLRTSGNTTAVGFTQSGGIIIGDPEVSISLASSAGSYASVNFNKAMSTSSGVVLYSQDYNSTTAAGMATYNVVLQPTSDEMHLGDTITATVIQTSTYAETSFTIPDGCWVLSIAAETTYQTALSGFINKLALGDQITFTISCSDEWLDVVSACGAGDMLVVNGEAQTTFTFSATSAASRTARTAIGCKADGSIVLYTVDGAQEDYSDGLTLTELAQRMVELGCVTAVNLDGGGSTTMGATIDLTYSTINSPSDSGSQRKVANGIFLLTEVENLPVPESYVLPTDDSRFVVADSDTSDSSDTTDSSDSLISDTGDNSTADTGGSTEIDVSGTASSTGSTATASTEAVSSASGVTVFGFEDVTESSGSGTTVALNTDQTWVKYGQGSMALTYDLEGRPSGDTLRRQSVTTLSLPVRDDRLALGVWVYGDGSGNALSVRYEQNGTEHSLWIGQISFTGWGYLTTTLPLGTESITGFAITEQDTTTAVSGTIYIDQLLLSTTTLTDTTAPAFSLSVGTDTLAVGVTDDESGVDTITVTIDGVKTAYTWSSNVATISLPDDGEAHLITVTAKDGAGNLASVSYELEGTVSDPFSDTAGHWAETAIVSLYHRGIISGSTDETTRQLVYRPNDSMTRQEFAVALINWLGVDASEYANVDLPYVDTASIASWARNAMKAAYALGIMSGSAETDGMLYCYPTSTITRQEAMTLIGRTQEKGYAESSLSVFADSDTIASWAEPYIAGMVSRGVISGIDGNLEPYGTVTRAQVAKMLYTLG